MTIDELRTEFYEKGVKFNGLLLFQNQTALEFITKCEANGFRLLGVDGFKIFGGKIQPFQEHSNDFEDQQGDQISFYSKTKDFLMSRANEELWFEVFVE